MVDKPSAPTSNQTSLPPTEPPSPPPASESFFSDLDSLAGGSSVAGGFATAAYFDAAKIDISSLNLISWKQGVDVKSDGSDKRGFNAISTVLAHPTKKANPLRASRKPLPPLAHPGQLPKFPPPTHYDAYLQAITPLWETFSSSQASSSSTQQVEKPNVELPSLDAIPDLYFTTDFDLSDPGTWAAVVGQAQSSTAVAPIPPKVQDAISTDLDHLERHLVHEISLRSSAFFSALSNLQDLHAESASCLERISSLRSALHDVGANQANKGLEIISAQAKLADLRHVESVMRDVGILEDTLETAEGLVTEGDWTGAVVCMEDIGRWWERHAQGEQPLTGLAALEHYPSTVRYLCKALAGQLESALGSLLAAALEAGQEAYEKEAFRRNAGQLIAGLARCEASHAVESVWREAALNAVRVSSREHLPTSRDDDAEIEQTEGKGQTLARALRDMDHAAFVLLSQSMYDTILARLDLIRKMGEDLGDIQSEISSMPSLALAPLPEPTSTSRLEKTDVLLTACELANTRAAKILATRTEQHASLAIEEFVEIFNVSWAFVLACEAIANKMIVSLRGVIASQARAFLLSYHGQRLTKSAKLVEEEQWAQVDVPASAQEAVDRLISSAVADPAALRIPPPESAAANNGADAQKVVKVEERSFFVVNATLQSLQLIEDYLRIVINLELVVTDVMSRVIEFLKSFNSRTCQVVLGAGAMRSAGLKNITAKHLALASQSLSVVVALIPYIREFIRRHLGAKQAVMLVEFDKLKRDYQEHQNEIHAKLVAIMSDRLAVHCASLREIDWENATTKDGPKPYVEMLAKETATLHKVLSKYLATQTVEFVMSQVIVAIVERLKEEYGKVEFKSDDAKKRMLLDVALLVGKLGPLSERSDDLTSLETLVKDKATPRKNWLRRSGSTKTAFEGDAGAESQEGQEVEEPVDMGDDDDVVAAAEETKVQPAASEAETEIESAAVAEQTPAPTAASKEETAETAAEQPELAQPVSEPINVSRPGEEAESGSTQLVPVDEPSVLLAQQAADPEPVLEPEVPSSPAALEERVPSSDVTTATAEEPLSKLESESKPKPEQVPQSPTTILLPLSAPPSQPMAESSSPAPPSNKAAPPLPEKAHTPAPATPTKPLPPQITSIATSTPPERKLSLAERLRGVATSGAGAGGRSPNHGHGHDFASPQ